MSILVLHLRTLWRAFSKSKTSVTRSVLILSSGFSSDCVPWHWSQLTLSCGFCRHQRLMSLTFLCHPGSWDGFPWLSSRNFKPLSQPALPFPFWTSLPRFRGWLPPATNYQGKNQWNHLYLLLLSPLPPIHQQPCRVTHLLRFVSPFLDLKTIGSGLQILPVAYCTAPPVLRYTPGKQITPLSNHLPCPLPPKG